MGLHGSSVDDLGVVCVFWVANDSGMAVFALVAACGLFFSPFVTTVVARASSVASTSPGLYKDGMENFGGCLYLLSCFWRSDKWEVVVSGFLSDLYGMNQP